MGWSSPGTSRAGTWARTGRTYRVRLTPRATDFLASVLPDHLRRMQELIHALTPAERETFVMLIEKLRDRVQVFRHD